MKQTEQWDTIIKPSSSLFEIDIRELWRYRDLIIMFTKRDIVANYKQTILGPIWFFIQPLLTTITFVVIFGNIAKISTDGLPKVLFYLAGITCWNYFSECLTRTANTFRENANIFGKVYFPRLVVPLSIIISNLIKFAIQLLLFLIIWLYFLLFTDSQIHITEAILLLPVLIFLMAGLGLGFGIIFSSLTTKYKDLVFLLTFGVQLAMYATPVIYPLSTISDKYKPYIMANPVTAIVETFRYGFLGTGTFSWEMLVYSLVCTLVVLMIGVVIFNKVEKTFMDTV
ncbi:MAG: ABC transporter permease [Flammeovirgaceae bacterium]|nr:ABC transporter permease [Flammeovirgaceae bacterium]MDW8287527.1 ABC transporter permease [Flammeovirgaceae bacterium]